jgi:hypothetical protein
MRVWCSLHKILKKVCKIGGFHCGDYVEWHLLGCYAMWLL